MSNNTALSAMAGRLQVNEVELQNIILNTVMPTGRNAQVTQEQFLSFLSVANEYQLNPLTKEIYAFPTKGGGIQPIVSIDGWLKIINSHHEFDGMEFTDNLGSDGLLQSVTCRIFRNDRKHPTEVTEYMDECRGDEKDKYGNLTPWGKWPARMLRHKATIQAARYAFGLSGIIDPDEAVRYEQSGVIEKEVNPSPAQATDATGYYPDDQFQQLLPQWRSAICGGNKTADQIIEFLSKKGANLSADQVEQIKALENVQ